MTSKQSKFGPITVYSQHYENDMVVFVYNQTKKTYLGYIWVVGVLQVVEWTITGKIKKNLSGNKKVDEKLYIIDTKDLKELQYRLPSYSND